MSLRLLRTNSGASRYQTPRLDREWRVCQPTTNVSSQPPAWQFNRAKTVKTVCVCVCVALCVSVCVRAVAGGEISKIVLSDGGTPPK